LYAEWRDLTTQLMLHEKHNQRPDGLKAPDLDGAIRGRSMPLTDAIDHLLSEDGGVLMQEDLKAQLNDAQLTGGIVALKTLRETLSRGCTAARWTKHEYPDGTLGYSSPASAEAGGVTRN